MAMHPIAAIKDDRLSRERRTNSTSHKKWSDKALDAAPRLHLFPPANVVVVACSGW
jgi:hypothetical protein